MEQKRSFNKNINNIKCYYENNENYCQLEAKKSKNNLISYSRT